MNKVCFSIACGALLMTASAATGPSPAISADCKRRVLHAHQMLEQARQQHGEKIAVVRFISETAYQVPGKQQSSKTMSRFVVMSRNDRTYISNGELDVYQDRQTQVCVVRAQRIILITQVPSPSRSNLNPIAQLRDQFITQARITRCSIVRTKSGTQRRIMAVPVAPSPLVGKVTLLEYWLEPNSDRLQKMTMHYPKGNQVTSVGMIFQSQGWKAADSTVDIAPLRQVLGADNKLLPAYQTYELQDLRNG